MDGRTSSSSVEVGQVGDSGKNKDRRHVMVVNYSSNGSAPIL
jgi:hypothetical protein